MTHIEDLEQFGIYEVDARNFQYAVYDGAGEMVGVRLKWGKRYLFGEHFAGPSSSVAWIGDRVGVVPEAYADGTPIRAGLFDERAKKSLLEWLVEWEMRRNRTDTAKRRLGEQQF